MRRRLGEEGLALEVGERGLDGEARVVESEPPPVAPSATVVALSAIAAMVAAAEVVTTTAATAAATTASRQTTPSTMPTMRQVRSLRGTSVGLPLSEAMALMA